MVLVIFSMYDNQGYIRKSAVFRTKFSGEVKHIPLNSLVMMLILILCIILCISAPLGAQDFSERPLQKLIDCPSAGGPEKGSYDFELRTYPGGGVLAGFTVGLFNRFVVGISYGGAEIIGFDQPDWNPQPCVAASYRLIDETMALPALSVGFNDQGYGAWLDEEERYQFKAKGFYGVVGKNFSINPLGEFGAHFGVNTNPMVEDDEGIIDLFTAVDYRMTQQISLIAEYSPGFNDQKGDSTGIGRGYLNFGIRWTFAERLAIDLHLRDILINQETSTIRPGKNFGREIRISYVEQL